MVKKVTSWYPRDGKRLKGRQITRWEDNIKAVAGSGMAKQGNRWRGMEDSWGGLCQAN